MDYVNNKFDIIVVGAGHAGCEAALSAARLGCNVLLCTLNLDNIGIFLASFLLYHYIVIFAIPICKNQSNKQKWVAPYGTTQQDHFMADSLFHSIRLLNIF